MSRRTTLVLVVAVSTLASLACSGGGGSPTAPAPAQPVTAEALELVEADLQVGGQSVNGKTMQPGHANGQPALFMARLTSNGQPATGHEVWVKYDRPMGMMGMMGASDGRFRLYDDGTHGDQTPGDGVYCFLDTEARYGCHGANMPNGEYHYEYWGEQHGGPESNHMHVRVRLGSN